MKIIYRAYLLLLIAILITGVISRRITIDIHFHDTKLVMAHFYISLVFFLYVLMLTVVNYWVSIYKKYVSFFQWLVFTIAVLTFVWILCVSFFQSNRFVGRTIDITGWHNFSQFQKLNEITSILSLFFVLTHLCILDIFPGSSYP